MDKARIYGEHEVVAYLEAAQVRFFLLFFFPIFIFSCEANYYSLTMYTVLTGMCVVIRSDGSVGDISFF